MQSLWLELDRTAQVSVYLFMRGQLQKSPCSFSDSTRRPPCVKTESRECFYVNPCTFLYLRPSPENYKIQKKELENDFECKNKS
jgi:hypothetical protein